MNKKIIIIIFGLMCLFALLGIGHGCSRQASSQVPSQGLTSGWASVVVETPSVNLSAMLNYSSDLPDVVVLTTYCPSDSSETLVDIVKAKKVIDLKKLQAQVAGMDRAQLPLDPEHVISFRLSIDIDGERYYYHYRFSSVNEMFDYVNKFSETEVMFSGLDGLPKMYWFRVSKPPKLR
ncbi:MAG: hypothetical protein K2X32_10570 [Phycisphaerales bacterium]|nr:hypothetical protein [Phycisphaerales bacterium]